MDYRYFGEYVSFTPADKAAGELLQSADYVIGEEVFIEFRTEEGTEHKGEVAWVKNRFGAWAGSLSPELSRQLRIFAARGWVMRAYLSLVAFTDTPHPGFYWGQIALFCFDPQLKNAFDSFALAVSLKLAEGIRLQIALSEQEIDRVISSQGSWMPTARAELVLPEQGKTAVLKKSQSFSERMIELGRERRPGCLAIGWVFNICAVGGLVALILHWCGLF